MQLENYNIITDNLLLPMSPSSIMYLYFNPFLPSR